MTKPSNIRHPPKKDNIVPAPTLEFHKPPYMDTPCPKIKFISPDKLAEVAIVLDFSIDD
jgi:hypothetical protein